MNVCSPDVKWTINILGENEMDLEMEWMEYLAMVDGFDPETKKFFDECDKLEEELGK